jgi:hypothetical protein
MIKRANDAEYDSFKCFLAWACNNGARPSNAHPESHPMYILEQAEGKVPHAALKAGLREAINDSLEKFTRWPAERVRAADEELHQLGVLTLTQMRFLFSSDLRRIEKRGTVQTEEEFRLVRNALEMPMIQLNPRRAKKLIAILAEFEGI